MSLREAETYLNAGRVQTQLLLDGGFIKPFVVVAAVRTGEHNFAIEDLDGLIAKLMRDAVEVDAGADADLSEIPAAAKRVQGGAAEIFQLIVYGKLTFVGRLRGEKGYLAVQVSVSEIKGKLDARRPEGFTARQLEGELRTTTKVVHALITNGHLPTKSVINPANRCPIRLVEEADVNVFRDEFVSKERGLHIRTLKMQLKATGIMPALIREMYRARDSIGAVK